MIKFNGKTELTNFLELFVSLDFGRNSRDFAKIRTFFDVKVPSYKKKNNDPPTKLRDLHDGLFEGNLASRVSVTWSAVPVAPGFLGYEEGSWRRGKLGQRP